jgi:pectate lyase
MKKGSKNVTISWNHIHDSWKMSLLGSSNSDRGTWLVTYHHNYYFRIGSRMPSIRGGTAHIFNNYYKEIFVGGVNTRLSAQVLVENNYFERVNNAIVSADSASEPGFAVNRGNIFIPKESETMKTSSSVLVPKEGTLTSVPYTCTVDPTEKVPALAVNFAGVGKIP